MPAAIGRYEHPPGKSEALRRLNTPSAYRSQITPTLGAYPFRKAPSTLSCSRPEMPATVIPAAMQFLRPFQ